MDGDLLVYNLKSLLWYLLIRGSLDVLFNKDVMFTSDMSSGFDLDIIFLKYL
jgi:hypothetical protein